MLTFGDERSEEVQITSWEGGMRLCFRMAFRVAPPSLPVVLVRASMVPLLKVPKVARGVRGLWIGCVGLFILVAD